MMYTHLCDFIKHPLFTRSINCLFSVNLDDILNTLFKRGVLFSNLGDSLVPTTEISSWLSNRKKQNRIEHPDR